LQLCTGDGTRRAPPTTLPPAAQPAQTELRRRRM